MRSIIMSGRLTAKESLQQRMARHQKLDRMIADHDLTTRAIAEVCGVSIKTVNAWRCWGPQSKDIPEKHLARLCVAL
jgi:hypothetical protein